MKVGDLIDYLIEFENNEELEIEVYESTSGKYIDSTCSIAISDEAVGPTLRISVKTATVKGKWP